MTEETPRPSLSTEPDPARGSRALLLLLRAQSWIHRRVETMTLGADGTTRRSMSFDLTVPDRLAVELNDDQVLVPLALIEKGAIRRVDTGDPDGHPFAVLGAADNALLAADLLYFALDPVFEISESPSQRMLGVIPRMVSYASGEDPDGTGRAELEAELNEAVRNAVTFSVPNALIDSFDVPTFIEPEVLEFGSAMARTFMDRFLLSAVIDRKYVGQRIILKFAYDRELPTTTEWAKRGAISYSLEDAGLAASTHVEFVAPPGLTVAELAVEETREGAPARPIAPDAPERPRSVAHVAFTPEGPRSGAEVRAFLEPASSGIFTFAAVSVAAVAVFSMLVILALAGVPILKDGATVPGQAVSLLLLGPALFLSWMARAPEHRALAALLLPLRVALIACTAVLVLAGVAVVVPLEEWAVALLWRIVPAFGLLNAFVFVLYATNSFDVVRRTLQKKKTSP